MSDRRRRLLPRTKRVRVALVVLVLLLVGARARRLPLRAQPHRQHLPPARALRAAADPHAAQGETRAPDRFSWPIYGYTKNHTRFFPAPERVRPPFKRLWVHNEHALLEFPPVIYGDHIFQLADNAVLSAINKHTGHTLLDASRSGSCSASTPAVDRQHRLRHRAHDRQQRGARAHRRAQRQATGAIRWSRGAAQPERVLAAGRPRPRLLRLPERHRLRAQRPQRAASSGPTTPPAPSRPAPPCSGGVLYFGDYSGHVQAISEQHRAPPVDQRAPKARCSAAAPSTRPPPSSTGASTSATPTGASTPTTPPAASSTGPCRPAPTSTPPPPSPTPPASGRRSTSAPTTAPSTRSTPAPGASAGSYNAARAHLRVGHDHRAHRLLRRPRPAPHLRPRHLHRPRPLQMDTGAFDPVISDGTDIYLTGYTGLYGLAPR